MGQYNSPFPGAQVDDAVSKRHTQNTDTKLDEGGANEVSAAQVKGAVDNSHVQGTDQTLDAGGPNEVTAADAADAVTKAHDQNTDTALDTGGPNEITAATLAELASAERGEQFFQTVLQPVGVDTPPDVLYWPTPYRAIEMDATAVRAGSDATFFDRFGVLQNADPDTFRRDFDPATGAFRGTLAEPQRENLLLWSEDISNAAWGKIGLGAAVAPIVSVNDALAPDGTLSADRVDFDCGDVSSGANRSILRGPLFTTIEGVSYVDSFWIKAASPSDIGKQLRLIREDPGNSSTILTLTADWQRIIYNTVSGSGVSRGTIIETRGGVTQQTASAHIWGAQLEQAPFPSSYIKTEATTVTRPADTLTIPQVGDRRRGFICWQGVMRQGPNDAFTRGIPFRNTVQAQTFLSDGNRLRLYSPVGGVFNADDLPSATDWRGRLIRCAYWWDVDAQAWGASYDGVSAVRSAAFGAPTDSPITFGQVGESLARGSMSSHTDWIYISYQIPSIEQIEALTGAVL